MWRPLPPPERIAAWVLIALVAVLGLVRGGVDPWAPFLASLVALVALAPTLRSEPEGLRATPLLAGLAVAALASMLQLVLIPPWTLRHLSPAEAEILGVSLTPLGLYPAARPLSLDAAATAGEAARAAALLAAAAAGVAIAGTRRLKEVVLGGIAAAGGAAVLVTLGAAFVGLGSLLAPRTTFVNPNHLAGFLALGAWPALGFALRQRGRERAAWLAVFGLCVGGILLSLSRAGIAALFVGAGVFAVLRVRRSLVHGMPLRVVGRRMALAAGLGLGLTAVVYLAADPVLDEMRTVTKAAADERFELWPTALKMIRRYPLAGVGRGAFATVFPVYRTQTELETYTHIENEWLQLPLDLGLPVGLAVIAALAWTWWSGARRADLSRPEIGALAAIAAVAAHNAFDFSLELLGVSVPFVLLLASVAGESGWPRLGRRPVLAVAVLLVGLAAAGTIVGRRHSADTVLTAVRSGAEADEVVRVARSALRWRPADYIAHAAAGVRLVQEGRCAEAMPWLGRAMWLGAMAPEPHRYAARCLAGGGKNDLAKREYRLAQLLGDTLALREVIHRYHDAADLLDAVPDSMQGITELATVLSAEGRYHEARHVMEKAFEEYREPEVLSQLGHASLADGDAKAALDQARLLASLETGRSRAAILEARSLQALGDTDAAVTSLRAAASRFPGDPDVVLSLGEMLLQRRHFAEASRVLETGVWRSTGESASARLLRAQALRGQGRFREAVAEARAAREIDPRNGNAPATLSEILADAGLVDEAIAVLETAERQHGSPAAYRERVKRLREQAASRRIGGQMRGSGTGGVGADGSPGR